MSLKDEKLGVELSAYLDGELGDRDAERIEETLRGSAELRAELESMRSMREALRSLPRASAPAGMADRVLLRAERATLLDGRPVDAAGRTGGGWVGRLAAAAVILIAVGVGLTVLSRMGRTKDPDDAVAINEDNRVIHAPGAPKLRRSVAPVGKAGKGNGGGVADATVDVLNPPVMHFTLNTDNLDLVQHDVQRVLDDNGLQDVAMVNDAPKTQVRRARSVARGGNYYDQVAANPNRVEIDIVVDETQLQKVIADLTEIRSNQRVAQAPEPEAADLAVADRTDKGLRERKSQPPGARAVARIPAPAPVRPSISKSGPVETSTNVRIAAAADTVNGTSTVAATQQKAVGTGTVITQPAAPGVADPEVLTIDGVRGRAIGGGTVYAKIRQLRIVLNAVEADLNAAELGTQPAVTTKSADAAK